MPLGAFFVEGLPGTIALYDAGHDQLRRLEGSEALPAGDAFTPAPHLVTARYETGVDDLSVDFPAEGAMHRRALGDRRRLRGGLVDGMARAQRRHLTRTSAIIEPGSSFAASTSMMSHIHPVRVWQSASEAPARDRGAANAQARVTKGSGDHSARRSCSP